MSRILAHNVFDLLTSSTILRLQLAADKSSKSPLFGAHYGGEKRARARRAVTGLLTVGFLQEIHVTNAEEDAKITKD